jgi:hypothetical protein
VSVSGVAIDTDAAAAAAWFSRSALVPALAEIAAAVEHAASRGDLAGEAVGAVEPLAAAGAAATAFATRVEDLVGSVIAGDALAPWDGWRDGFPYGHGLVGGFRVYRTGTWFAGALDGAVPVFNNGTVGVGLASVLRRFPSTAAAGRWLTTPGATQTFRWAGVAGAGFSTAVGLHDLWHQGNPVDAVEREGAGYVADAAGTAFSASTAAFLLAPNPVTGALVVGTGLVWLGAEAWDAWGDEISAWVDGHADDLATAAGAVWDAGSEGVSAAWSVASTTAGDALDGVSDVAGGLWDVGSGLVGGFGDAAGGLIG